MKNVVWFKREDKAGMSWEWEYAPLESGMVDWKGVTTVLKAVGYDGYLSVEDLYGTHLSTRGLMDERLATPDVEVLPALEKLRKDLAYLRSQEAARPLSRRRALLPNG